MCKRADSGHRNPLAAPTLALLSATIFTSAPSWATPPEKATMQVISLGVLSESINLVFHHPVPKGLDVSEIVVVKYTIEPGGSLGWQQHGGPSWWVITAGKLAVYDGEDPTCLPTQYPVGSALLESGNHTYNARNEGNIPVEAYTTYMLAADANTNIDAPDPGYCGF